MSYFNRLLAVLLVTSTGYAQSSEADIRKALFNYMDGFYNGDTSLFYLSIDPGVGKYGYYKDNGAYVGDDMSFQEMIRLAKNVRLGKFKFKENPRREVQLIEAGKHIAVGKVLADWGFDYILLAKENKKWMVKYILWQNDYEAHSLDSLGVKEALSNYIDGLYKGESSLLKKSISENLSKYGLIEKNGETTGRKASLNDLISFAESVKSGSNKIEKNALRKVKVLQTNDKTALGRVDTIWGFDYVLLANESSVWEIKYILWQTN
jgi:hypothetical protein